MRNERFSILFCLLVLVIFLAVFTFGCAGDSAVPESPDDSTEAPDDGADDPIKVAVILYGTADDYAWNAGMINSMTRVYESGDYNIEVDFMENAYGQGEPAMRDYIERGYTFIIAQGSGFIDDVDRVAKDHPEVYFLSGMAIHFRGDNINNFMAHYHEGGFLAGALAAMMSENRYVASVGGMAHPTTIAACESFLDGARYVDPDIRVAVIYAGDYEDPGAGSDAAAALIDDGADVINNVGNGTGLGVVSTAVERGVMFTGFFDDQYALAPNNHLTSVANVWDGTIRACLDQIIAGTFGGHTFYENLEGGGLALSPWESTPYDIPQEYRDRIAEIRKMIIDGEIEVDERLETFY